MLLFTVLSTLLCSSLVDARLAPVKSDDALQQCQSQGICDNAALDISAEFRPTIKASAPGGVKLRLAVQSNQRLTFLVRTEDYSVTWEITRDKCVWEIGSSKNLVSFQESKDGSPDGCVGKTGRDVSVTVDVKGKSVEVADVDGPCKKPLKLNDACSYAPPDSASIPNWDVWTLSISAPGSPDPSAIIKLTNAFVVYEAPDSTTAVTPDYSGTGVTGNDTTTTGGPENLNGTTTNTEFGAMTWGLVGGCALFFVLFVVAVIVAVILSFKLKKERSTKKKEEPRKKDGLDDRSKPIPLDGNGVVPEIAICESKSKRMVDEKQVAAAEAQNPAPGEAPTELKSQEVTNKGPDGTSTQPAADPTNNV